MCDNNNLKKCTKCKTLVHIDEFSLNRRKEYNKTCDKCLIRQREYVKTIVKINIEVNIFISVNTVDKKVIVKIAMELVYAYMIDEEVNVKIATDLKYVHTIEKEVDVKIAAELVYVNTIE